MAHWPATTPITNRNRYILNHLSQSGVLLFQFRNPNLETFGAKWNIVVVVAVITWAVTRFDLETDLGTAFRAPDPDGIEHAHQCDYFLHTFALWRVRVGWTLIYPSEYIQRLPGAFMRNGGAYLAVVEQWAS